MKKATFKITVIENGGHETYQLENKKAKDKWLYKYLTYQERIWAWGQWQNSTHKTFKKWFKEFIKPQWKKDDGQLLRINKKIIFIKKEEK